MRLLIVEDEVILRDSLAKSLGKERDVEAVFTLADAFDVVDVVAAKDIDIILMDVCTENDSSGLVAAQKVKEAYPDVRIVIMTGMPEITFVDQAREAGSLRERPRIRGGRACDHTPRLRGKAAQRDSQRASSERWHGQEAHYRNPCEDRVR